MRSTLQYTTKLIEEFNMLSKKSPGGANFPYYYKNGELFGAHYESFEEREQDLLALMRAEEEFMIKQNHPLPYWVNFYGTNLTNVISIEFMQSMNRLNRYIPKLAIVGCSIIEKWRMEKARKEVSLPIPVRYFNDPEVAKCWLVNER
jgi:hypothetical protein